METITSGAVRATRGGVRDRPRPTSSRHAEAARSDAEVWSRLLAVERGDGRGRSATSTGQSMLENFGVFRYPDKMEKQIGVIDDLRRRYAGVVVEDKGTVSTAT